MSRNEERERIIDILLTDLRGCDGGKTVYCTTCRGSESDDETEERCYGCMRKEFYWGISKKCASEIADRILESK